MTFQYGQITASSPLAFRTPVLSFPGATAVVSIRAALDVLPASITDATLDDLAGCNYENARQIAHRDLSPAMLAAFLPWLDTAIAYWSHEGESDDSFIALCEREVAGMDRLLATACLTAADQDLMTYFELLDTLDAPPLGKGLKSWVELEGSTVPEERFAVALRSALLSRSPLARALAFGDTGAANANANANADAELLTAFAGVRQGMSYLLDMRHDLTDRVPDWENLCGPFDDEIHQLRAQTIEGVVAKLRVAFQHTACQTWSDRAVVDPAHPDFTSGILGHKDATEQLLWDCIEDLACIGGIDLSKQGAEQRMMVLA
jgi:hypothetical protein